MPQHRDQENSASLDRVPIEECGEPLVILQHVCPRVEAGSRPLLLRRSAALRLQAAQEGLEARQPGYGLRVGDTYRSPEKQAKLFRLACFAARLLHPFWPASQIREATDRYVADPDALTPPPHTTGGAVDVGLLTPTGRRAYMGPFTLAAARTDYSPLSPEARQHRQLLCSVMEAAGFSNYPEEWWHWSYGDSHWALRTGEATACYGQVRVQIAEG